MAAAASRAADSLLRAAEAAREAAASDARRREACAAARAREAPARAVESGRLGPRARAAPRSERRLTFESWT